MLQKSFLTDHRQRVAINGEISSWRPVTSGVPQGSVLGPLLFKIFINDISAVKLFANDITINKEIVCPHDVGLLQLDLSKVVQWTKTWLLHLNPDKCESIVISNKSYHLFLNIVCILNSSLISQLFVIWVFLLTAT